jgi:hypothetical protein
MRNESWLDAVADATAADIVGRYVPDCPNRRKLEEAVSRLCRIGLEGHLQQFESQQRPPACGD